MAASRVEHPGGDLGDGVAKADHGRAAEDHRQSLQDVCDALTVILGQDRTDPRDDRENGGRVRLVAIDQFQQDRR